MTNTYAFINFNPDFAFTSASVFWIFVISVILTLGFTAVVFIGGIGDLRFLLRSMNEARVEDPADDGRVTKPGAPPEH